MRINLLTQHTWAIPTQHLGCISTQHTWAIPTQHTGAKSTQHTWEVPLPNKKQITQCDLSTHHTCVLRDMITDITHVCCVTWSQISHMCDVWPDHRYHTCVLCDMITDMITDITHVWCLTWSQISHMCDMITYITHWRQQSLWSSLSRSSTVNGRQHQWPSVTQQHVREFTRRVSSWHVQWCLQRHCHVTVVTSASPSYVQRHRHMVSVKWRHVVRMTATWFVLPWHGLCQCDAVRIEEIRSVLV